MPEERKSATVPPATMTRRPTIHTTSALLRAVMGIVTCACFAAGLLMAPPLRADVNTNSGEKPKKDPKDKKKDEK